MKNHIYIIKLFSLSVLFVLSIMGTIFILASCEQQALPDVGSQPDLTPPSADFSTIPDNADSKKIKFSNLSSSATDFLWDFGDGNTSIDKEPSNLYPTEGIYTVTLVATDKLNVSNSITKEVEVTEPALFEPVILEPSFEDGMLEDDAGDGRDSWRISGGNRPGGMGGVIQITSSPVLTGDQAAKLPSNNERAGYQLITVIPDSDYRVSFNYTMKTSPVGSLTVYILGGNVTDPADVAAATIASITVNDQTDANVYKMESIEFNSGSNTAIAIYFINDAVETRLDDFKIENN